ncbi:MAG: Putative nickel-responsive regulator [Methanobacteriota archaeon]|nr:MAG: Putative nickel-responsive regulator [Euryarchaeota archaeon]
MSRIVSFSTDNEFADNLDNLVTKSGYKNRSRFIRDASLYFADLQQRGPLEEMDDNEEVEGLIIIYYQHGIEQKLLNVRHSNGLKITSYNHSCLTHSHTCVDTMQAFGNAKEYRVVIEKLQNTPNVDKVVFVSAPMRDDGCC